MGRRWKGPTIEWSYAWEETISFRGQGDLSYCTKIGRMSGMLVSGTNFSITKQVMSDDIDDIQDPKYHIYSYSCESQVKSPNHRVVICVRRDRILPGPWIFILLFACLACWCRGQPFHHQVSNVWRHWWHSRSQVSHEPSDMFLTCT